MLVVGEDLFRGRVVGGAVDIEFLGDLSPRRGPEQVLQGTAGNRIDALVELVDVLHREAAKQQRRVPIELFLSSSRFSPAHCARPTPGTLGVHSKGIELFSNSGVNVTRLDWSRLKLLRRPLPNAGMA